jgi:negative regulator of flagellin synthesis FlgM
MAIESITGRLNGLSSIKPVKKAEVDDQNQVPARGVKHEQDGVATSTVIQDFKKAVELSPASSVDLDRVNSIKKAIAEGSYQINPEKIAKKMIEFEQLSPPHDST